MKLEGKELWNIKAGVTRLLNATLLSTGEQLILNMILIYQKVYIHFDCLFVFFGLQIVNNDKKLGNHDAGC
jgi:hypothetical protein